jgi:hypothetical protein
MTDHLADLPTPAPSGETQKSIRRLNSKLIEARLHSGTPAYAQTERELVQLLIEQQGLLGPAAGRFAAVLDPDEAMAEILPDLVVGWRGDRVHWFSVKYLKRAVSIRAQQLRRDVAGHRSLDADAPPAAPEPAARVEGLLGALSEEQVRHVFREFLAGLKPEERRLLHLARLAGKGEDGHHRQGWQKAVGGQLRRPPCWVTRRLDALFRRLATLLGRPDLRRKKRRKRVPV